ncbi:MAG: hydroxymethylglutaryl-CoA reductase, degradative [Phycisphaerae bacterium]|nr:hydroxymethylglutaryl-CoA reductase, degradative [Phycisphaerae bacterium]
MKFRKLTIQARRQQLTERHGPIDWLPPEPANGDYLAMVEAQIENGIGIMGLALGLATGFVIDGTPYDLPLATEEPSVIAAASFAATVAARSGGFVTTATDPLMAFQVVFEDPEHTLVNQFNASLDTIKSLLTDPLTAMTRRGGGLRDIIVTPIPELPAVKIQVTVDVRDAQGANLLNTCAERVGDYLAGEVGQRPLMCIVCNAAAKRRATAACHLTCAQVGQLCKGQDPAESTRRVVQAGRLAQVDRDRAVTHNKGIMNGITALALATGNDTRALEAAVHAWASRDGLYQGLSHYETTPEGLHARLELPLPLATVGGCTQHHPTSRFALSLLGHPNSVTLMRIAAALGLAQNIAALCALVSTGIQQGHMPRHARKERSHDATV